MKRLIAIDIDGTLSTSNKIITENTIKIIKEVENQGDIITLATGRPRGYAEKISTSIGLNKYLITSDGSELYDLKNKRVISQLTINNEIVLLLMKYLKENNMNYSIVSKEREYSNILFANQQILITSSIEKELKTVPIKQIFTIDEQEEKIIKTQQFIEQNNLLDHTSKITMISNWLYINHSQSTKGNAVLQLANHISADNIITIGNDPNDISMFEIADTAVAVENANDEVKEYADVITDSNDNEGVAKYLKSLIK